MLCSTSKPALQPQAKLCAIPSLGAAQPRYHRPSPALGKVAVLCGSQINKQKNKSKITAADFQSGFSSSQARKYQFGSFVLFFFLHFKQRKTDLYGILQRTQAHRRQEQNTALRSSTQRMSKSSQDRRRILCLKKVVLRPSIEVFNYGLPRTVASSS